MKFGGGGGGGAVAATLILHICHSVFYCLHKITCTWQDKFSKGGKIVAGGGGGGGKSPLNETLYR